MKTKNKRAVFVFLICVTIFTGYSGADVIKLKKGREIEGAIVDETKDTVTIDMGIGEATLNKNDIRSIQRAQKANAAIYYLRAASFADYGNYGAPKNRIDSLEKKKFCLSEKELSEMVENNKKCLDEIARGLAIKECDFYFEDKYNSVGSRKQKQNQKEVMYLHSLLLLQGRYYENRKDFARAIDSYLAALNFAAQIAQGSDPEFRTAAILIEKNTYPIIEEYIRSKNADPGICRKIFSFLNEYEKTHFSAVDFLKGCKEYFINWFDLYKTDITRWTREDAKLDDKTKEKANNFSEELTKQAKDLADRYYGDLISAAGTDSEKDWKSAQDEYDALVKDAKPEALGDEVDLEFFISKTMGDVKEYDKKDPKTVAVTILSAALSYDKKSVDIYRENGDKLKELELLAAQKTKAMKLNSKE